MIYKYKITPTEQNIVTKSSEARKTYYHLQEANLPALKSDNTGNICKRYIVTTSRKHLLQ
jgi:hypothetical protein